MTNRKKVLILGLVLVFSVIFSTNTFAEEGQISETKRESIIENCDTIQDSLTAMQHSDSYARTYLGSLYDAILNRFIVPFNVRLIKNDQSIAELTELQADFIEARADFNEDFVLYSKELEALIGVNCETEPENFYQQLEKTRAKRAVVDTDTKNLEKLVFEHKQIIVGLKEEL